MVEISRNCVISSQLQQLSDVLIFAQMSNDDAAHKL